MNSEKTWDTIAKSFDSTRRKPWKECIEFIKELPSSFIVADLGCGNGRHLIPCAERCKKAIGVDFSKNLLEIAKSKVKERGLRNVIFVRANLTNIPFRDNSLDAVLYIASLHNIKGRKDRLSSLKEVKRILKKNGRALISVWSRWQDRYRFYFLKRLFLAREELGDIEIYWKKNNLNIPRFYHLYSKSEFKKDLNRAGLKILDLKSVKVHSKIGADNYFAIVIKKIEKREEKSR